MAIRVDTLFVLLELFSTPAASDVHVPWQAASLSLLPSANSIKVCVKLGFFICTNIDILTFDTNVK